MALIGLAVAGRVVSGCGSGEVSSRDPRTLGASASAPTTDGKTEVIDDGELCLQGTLGADVPLAVEVHPEGRCMSTSCTRWIENSCSVTREGPRIRIRSRQIFADMPPDRACTEDCGGAIPARCASTDPLPAGRYTVVFGKTELAIDVPSRLGSTCLGGGRMIEVAKPGE